MSGEEYTGNIRTKKALVRKDKLQKRRELGSRECGRRSGIICERFLASREYAEAESILLYKAYNDEVDTDIIFDRAVRDGKKVAYPLSRIIDGEPDLTFYTVRSLDQLVPGYKGILEPDETGVDTLFDETADICIVPGVAFDRKCNRIGYGKAFYDRYIRRNSPRTVIGLAYDVQITDEFETEESDRAMDMVITDSGVYSR